MTIKGSNCDKGILSNITQRAGPSCAIFQTKYSINDRCERVQDLKHCKKKKSEYKWLQPLTEHNKKCEKCDKYDWLAIQKGT